MKHMTILTADRSTEGSEKSPNPRKSGFTSLALTRAVRMIKIPSPALMPILIFLGISSTIFSRILNRLSTRNNIAEIMDMPRPTFQSANPGTTIE